jgi:hypothetical protein
VPVRRAERHRRADGTEFCSIGDARMLSRGASGGNRKNCHRGVSDPFLYRRTEIGAAGPAGQPDTTTCRSAESARSRPFPHAGAGAGIGEPAARHGRRTVPGARSAAQ